MQKLFHSFECKGCLLIDIEVECLLIGIEVEVKKNVYKNISDDGTCKHAVRDCSSTPFIHDWT